MTDERAQVWNDFKQAVNMTPAALAKFLDSDDSKRVGWKGPDGKGEGESVGHRSGERIVAILRRKKAELEDDDYGHMRKVVGYVHRHLKQGGPAKDKASSDWRWSLMNWGHDPCK